MATVTVILPMTCIIQLALQGSPKSLNVLGGWSTIIFKELDTDPKHLSHLTSHYCPPTTHIEPHCSKVSPKYICTFTPLFFCLSCSLHGISFLLFLFHTTLSLCNQDPARASHFLLSLLCFLSHPGRTAVSWAHRDPWIVFCFLFFVLTYLSH